jgi:hypothetical protein
MKHNVMNFIQIDVSNLAPPEPMMAILSALSELENPLRTTHQCLVVKHRREPVPLYEKLTLAGWAYHCQINTEDDILLFIYRQTSQQAFEQHIEQYIAPLFSADYCVEKSRHK